MPNFKTVISRHNQKLLKKGQQEESAQPISEPGCNCRTGPCPLDTANCQVNSVVYIATMKDEDLNVNTYTGLHRITFKQRYNAHKHSVNHRDVNSTTLSTHLWKLADEKNKI